MPAISVVIPVYNVEKYLHQCVTSIINQTFKDLEIILVDDGSKDRSGEICDELQSTDNRVKVIHKENGGVSKARNNGLQIATGEYIIFVDSDDWVPADAYEKMYNSAETNNADVVLGDAYFVTKNKTSYRKYFRNEFVHTEKTDINELIKALFRWTYCPSLPEKNHSLGYYAPWNKLAKRSILVEKNIKFDDRLNGICDDLLYSAYLLASVNKVNYIGSPVYYYRDVEYSLTNKYKNNIETTNQSIFNSINEFISNFNFGEYLEKPYAAFVINRFIYAVNVCYLHPQNKQSLQKKLSQIRELLQKEPYYSACNRADRNKLPKYDRIMLPFMKANLPLGIYFLSTLRRIIKAKK